MNLAEAIEGVAYLRRKRRRCPVCLVRGAVRILRPSLFRREHRTPGPDWREQILGAALRVDCIACGYSERYEVTER